MGWPERTDSFGCYDAIERVSVTRDSRCSFWEHCVHFALPMDVESCTVARPSRAWEMAEAAHELRKPRRRKFLLETSSPLIWGNVLKPSNILKPYHVYMSSYK